MTIGIAAFGDRAGQAVLEGLAAAEAVFNNHPEMLLKRGAELNTVGPNGRTPLITAIMSAVKETRYFQLLDELLARGADPNAGIDNPIGAGYRVPSPLKAAMCGNQTLENRRKVVGSS